MPTLYERIGGRDAVFAAVEIFYNRILSDPTIAHYFTGMDMRRQAGHQRLFLTYAFGGAPDYPGQTLREAHRGLDLSDEDFAAVAGHFKATLEELKVPAELQDEVMAIVGGTKADVLDR